MDYIVKRGVTVFNDFGPYTNVYVSLYTYEEDKEPSEITITYINLITGEGDEDENILIYG